MGRIDNTNDIENLMEGANELNEDVKVFIRRVNNPVNARSINIDDIVNARYYLNEANRLISEIGAYSHFETQQGILSDLERCRSDLNSFLNRMEGGRRKSRRQRRKSRKSRGKTRMHRKKSRRYRK